MLDNNALVSEVDKVQVRFILLLMPGFSLLSLGGFLDKLRFSGDDEDYSRQISCTWRIASLSDMKVIASCGAMLLPDNTVEKMLITRETCDYFVIFGANNPTQVISDAARYRPLIRGIRKRNIPLVSIDNAAFLLAACGAVKGKILVHWRHCREFKDAFPSLSPLTNKSVLLEDNIYSCPGGNAAIELAALLLEKRLGSARAMKGLSDMLVGGFASPSTQTWHYADLERVPAPARKALMIMQQHINGHLSAEEIASRSGLSRRQLDRCLLSETGLTVSQTYTGMKLNYACWLMLRTSRTLAQIAADCGFTDASHFSRHFRRKTGLTPARWRHTNTLNRTR